MYFIQYLIEKQNIDIFSYQYENRNNFLHLASEKGFLPFIKYIYENKGETVKIIIFGSESSDKTSLMLQIDRDFVSYMPTLDDSFYRTHIAGRYLLLNIRNYDPINGIKYFIDLGIEEGDGFILLYSYSDRKSFECIKSIYDDIRSRKKNNPHSIILVENNASYEERVVSKDEGEQLAKQFNCPFIEVSTLHNTNTKKPFEEISKAMIKSKSIPINDYLTPNGNGDYPLHIATQSNHLDIVQYFIKELVIDPNIKGNNDQTPLHYACSKGYLPIVRYLVSKNADLSAQDKSGKTPKDLAIQNNHLEIVKYLKTLDKK